jgi:SAM-dependent methyltransferase
LALRRLKRRADSYGAFAWAYDQSLGRSFFRTAARILSHLERRHPPGRTTHLDIACGTGLVMEWFRARGYRSTGLDASVSMLGVARQRVPRLVAGDLRDLPFAGPFGRITCLYDSLNHLLTTRDLVAALTAAGRLMDEESLFYFDLNHPEAYSTIWSMREPYVAEGDGFYLKMATSYSRIRAIGTGHVTGWARRGGEVIPIDEVHHQRAFTEAMLFRSLEKGGLEVVDTFRFHPFNSERPIDPGGLKIAVAARLRT